MMSYATNEFSDSFPQPFLPFFIPPPDYSTTMPQGYSAQSARLLPATRKPGSKPNTPTSSRRPHDARVRKYGPQGNSPHYIQRRRTTASHAARESNPWGTTSSRKQPHWNQISDARPFSWHPQSNPPHQTESQTTFEQSPLDAYMSDLGDLAVIEQASSIEHAAHPFPLDPFSNAQHYHSSAELGSAQTNGNMSAYYTPSLPLDMTPSYLQFGDEVQMQPQLSNSRRVPFQTLSDHTVDLSHPAFSDAGSQLPRNTNLPDTRGREAEGNGQDNGEHDVQGEEQEEEEEEEEEELVGIGLYDDRYLKPTVNSLAEAPTYSQGLAPAKELKLEETWHPQTDSYDDEGSSDEAEEADELPLMATPTHNVQPILSSPLGDLSDQSFLWFDDNDGLATDDHLMATLALHDGLENMPQWKGHPTTSGNLTYF